MNKTHLAPLLLTIGLTVVFGVFGIQKIVTPLAWIGWLPDWMEGLLGMNKILWTQGIGVFETLLALGLWIPRVKRWVALVMALHLLAVLTQTRFTDIGIRDGGLLFMSLGLFFIP